MHLLQTYIYIRLINTDAQEDVDIEVLLRLREKDVKQACPSGVEYCICTNNPEEKTTGPFSYDEDPLGTVYTYTVCNPGSCFCKDDPDTPKDARNWPMKAVLDTCPVGEMNRCLCHDDTKVKYPFDMRSLFLDCRPKRVRVS